MRKTILAIVIAVISLTSSSNSASGNGTLPRSNTTFLQEALFTELHPKIMSILTEKYHTDFIFDNARILPLTDSDVREFMIQGNVTNRTKADTVQITFQNDRTNGYKVVGFTVILSKKSNWN
ncbi:hypothetical protein ACFQZR_20625 [Paenibacillus sp. GCM10027629]|uniref:hypothetical protein n=1 Tax=Paenibacillus sp. GCM10027629 TaxID=3273414 RepID=UPI00363264A6